MRIPYTWVVGPWRSRSESRQGVGTVVHDDRGIVTRTARGTIARARIAEQAVIDLMCLWPTPFYETFRILTAEEIRDRYRRLNTAAERYAGARGAVVAWVDLGALVDEHW